MSKPNLFHLHVRRGYRTPFIGVTFKDHSPAVNLMKMLRKAWLLRVDEKITKDPMHAGVHNLFRYLDETPDEELVKRRDDDTENTTNAYREAIYVMWNHLFDNISNFLVNVNCSNGIFMPPSQGSWDIRFPEEGEEGERVKVAEFSHETHLLILPAFIDPGTKVEVTIGDEQKPLQQQKEEEINKTGFEFDATETEWEYLGTDIYLVKANQKMTVYVPREAKKAGKLAAVLVYGKYDENFADPNDEEHMRLHELYDNATTDEVHEKLKKTRWAGTGNAPDERELCSEILAIKKWVKDSKKRKVEEADEDNGDDEQGEEEENEAGEYGGDEEHGEQKDDARETEQNKASHEGGGEVIVLCSSMRTAEQQSVCNKAPSVMAVLSYRSSAR
ncbi:unnamed protein product [Clonostachys rosea]|uniref:Uncharacterized protein n=1 Tax=Bionectria ochroleuca TaxID=29856 RepID=A0ABY6UDB0_BIOOC|nr:unnamed protein product [Clonostachys rosea]